jgi:hypothetical protein
MDLENDPIFITGLDPKSQIVRMPCPSCVFSANAQNPASVHEEADDDDLIFSAQGGAVDAVFNVTISEDNELLINGDVCNFSRKARATGPKHVIQVPASVSAQAIVDGEAKTESLEVDGLDIMVGSDGVTSHLTYNIWSADRHPIHLDRLRISLLTLDDGEIMILDAHSEASAPTHLKVDLDFLAQRPPTHPTAAEKPCDIFCMMKSKFDHLRNSHLGKKLGCGTHKNRLGASQPITIGKVPGHLRPPFAQHRPHGPHHHHHHGRPSSLIAHSVRVALWVFACGMAAFVVGMLGAWTIVFVFLGLRKVFYGVPFSGRRATVSLDEDAAEEGHGLLAEDDKAEKFGEEAPPPVYEDAPAYEEKEEQK